jgi:lipoprotein-anchoring transpeptidase ErfK/SrfK
VNARLAGLALLLAAGVVALLAAVHHSSARTAPRTTTLAGGVNRLPPPERPALTVGRPRLLSVHEFRARIAPVLRAVPARSAPSRSAYVVAPLELKTSEGTTNIVLVVGERRGRDGSWVHIRLPVLPNNQTAWVPRRALGGYEFVHTHLVVDRSRLVATLFRDGRKVFSASVGIGKAQSPTPGGEFYVRDRLRGFGDPFYGPVAFGTSARSAVLTDWPDGGFVGIHGTNEPGLLPGRVSHGCIRLRNADILRLSKLMPVGTPVTIR